MGSMQLPPGPREPAAIQMAEWIVRPTALLRRSEARYGDPFTLTLVSGPIVLTGTPEGIQEILTAPPQTFASNNRRFLAPLVGEHSVLLLDGASHRHERGLLLPPFHGARLQAYGALIQDIAFRRAAAWRQAAEWTLGRG